MTVRSEDGRPTAGVLLRGGATLVDALLLTVAVAQAAALTRAAGLDVPVAAAASVLLVAAYAVVMVAELGQTAGKMAAGIRVVGKDGGPVPYARAAGRHLAVYLSAAAGGAGFAMAAWSESRQALHDRLAGTRVVREPGLQPWRLWTMTALGALCPFVLLGLSYVVTSPLIRAERRSRAPRPMQLVDAAERLEKQGDYEGAAAQFTRLIELFPAQGAWRLGRCRDRAFLGDLPGALADCDESVRLDDQPLAEDVRGIVLLRLGRLPEAEACFEKGLRSELLRPLALYGRGMTRQARGDRAAADRDLAEARRMSGIDELFDREGYRASPAAPRP